MEKITFKDDILPVIGVGSIAGFVACIIIFIWVDSYDTLKLVAKIAATLAVVAITSIQIGKILAKTQDDENH